MNRPFLLLSFLFAVALGASAQPDRWQQRAKYTMTIDMDVNTNRFTGKQKLEYSNNSPDTLYRVFYHLYWNAFQPNSMMDVRSRRQGTIASRRDRQGNEIPDWDPRVEDRILNLKPDEIGYEKVSSISMNGRPQKMKLHETILEVILDRPILPKSKAVFDLEWEAQVPIQVRRSGRDNPSTEVRYTMTQWYPKLCEYDYEGWHPTPYVGREFYGVWGDYDVSISIDRNYVLGGTGDLQNPNTIGFGYEAKGTKVPAGGSKRTWRFVAANVHDFAWAADPEYKHIVRQIPGGPAIHVLYNAQPSRLSFDLMSPQAKARYGNDFNNYAKSWDAQWSDIADAAVTVYPFIKKNFGEYPYKQYSFIHGGDGGMEYPNCTMLSGPSMGTAFHEWMHTWYQMLMGTNESLYAWMDEGFTEWATDLVEEYYRQQVSRKTILNDPAALRASDSAAMAPPAYHQGIYAGYLALARSTREEPMTTHADHFNTNYAYSTAAYSKGGVFVEQLGYIVGAGVRDRIMLEYYRQWRFKHPNVNDFMRVAEKVSGIQLDWYRQYWVNTTKTIDYSIDSLYEGSGLTNVRLKNNGLMPMPVDVKITFKDGTSEWHYVPMSLM
ncbi:MAG TPA: M1 family metallopeptidase, partial [Flavisolibacter sp.]|nr:M1 family metallopeptidase [Flavisolibacter sp.]